MQLLTFFFFFSSRRRHTRWNCDWSSDVCSSDLWTLPSGDRSVTKLLMDQPDVSTIYAPKSWKAFATIRPGSDSSVATEKSGLTAKRVPIRTWGIEPQYPAPPASDFHAGHRNPLTPGKKFALSMLSLRE